jgi:hypothetical protein
LGERIIMTQSMPWDDFATSRSEPVKEDEGNPWEEFAAQAKNDRPRSKLNSALQGAAQGATFGFSDEGLAGLKAAYDKFKEGGDWQDLYHKRVNAERRAISQAKEDNPLTYTGGLVGGSALTNLIPGVGIAKGAALGSTLGKATLQGALTGAGESTGKTQGDILVDTLKGGALGGVAQGVFSGLGGLAEKLTPTALKRFAEERAVKAALGPTEASIKKGLGLPKDGAPVEYVQSQIAKHGRNLLDEGVISPFNKTEDIGPRLTSAMRKYGSQIGEIGATVDDKLPGSFDPSKISQEILDYAATLPVAGKGGGLQDSLLKEAEKYQQMGIAGKIYDLPALEFKNIQQLKNQYPFEKQSADALFSSKDATNKLNYILGKNMDEAVAKAEKVGGDDVKGLLDRYQNAKEKYGTFKNASNASGKETWKDTARRIASPSDMAVGIGAGGYSALNQKDGDMSPFVAGALGLAAHRFARQRGASTSAVIANSLSKALGKSPQLAKQFGQILINAAERGPAALTATHLMLMKNPGYRGQIEGQSSGANEGAPQ